MYRRIGDLLFCLLFALRGIEGWGAPYDYAKEEALREKIFKTNSYNSQIRPYDKTEVTIIVGLYTLKYLDIKTETMETTIFPSLMWLDPRFFWANDPNYSSIYQFYAKSDDVWTPSIQVLNSVDGVSVIEESKVPITVNQGGFLVWSFGMSLTTNCYCDVTYYPFDTQTCELGFIVVGANYTNVELKLSEYGEPLQMDYFRQNGEWEVSGSGAEIQEQIVDGFKSRSVYFAFQFRRRPLFHFINSLVPVTLFSSLSCASFRVPAESGEKIGFCLTVLLGFAVYLTILTDFVPSTSISTSYLSLYLVCVLSLCVLAVFITIFVLECHHTDPDKPVPNCVTWFMRNILMPFTCSGCCCTGCCRDREKDYTDTRMRNGDCRHRERRRPSTTENNTVSWQEIGRIIDKTAFIVFVLATIVMTALTYTALLYGYFKKFSLKTFA